MGHTSKASFIQNEIKTRVKGRRTALPCVGAGVFNLNKSLCCFLRSRNGHVSVVESEDEIEETFSPSQMIFNKRGFRRFHISQLDIGKVLVAEKVKGGLEVFFSPDLKNWKPLGTLENKEITSGMLVSNYQINGDYAMYLGGPSMTIVFSREGTTWREPHLKIERVKVQRGESIEIDFVEVISQGILVCYRLVKKSKNNLTHKVWMALFDRNHPERMLWQSLQPVWEKEHSAGAGSVGGAVSFRSQLFGLWNDAQKGVYLIRYSLEDVPFELPRDPILFLERARLNPIINPRPQYAWESFATYNPAAFSAGGKVHILYRAQGDNLVSSIGYASSSDGVQIDERLEDPVYHPQEVFESYQKSAPSNVTRTYSSGGGIAGCEDPRAVVIEDRVFMTYVAFDGASPPRVALTSIAVDDLLKKQWNWTKPVLISPPGIVDKSAVIFPEKIQGQYVIMHRIFPNILIDYVPDLNFDGSYWLKAEKQIPIRDGMWDSRKIGAGAPPIKTDEGWLLIYYGVDDRDDRQYKIGAMLLDLEDPSKVLYRSSSPVLEPEHWYENSGFKPGVVYPCGAVLLGNMLHVYYGGADCVVCVASSEITSFLKALKSNHLFRLQGPRIRKVKDYAADTSLIKSIDSAYTGT